MKILALDTSTAACSVACYNSDVDNTNNTNNANNVSISNANNVNKNPDKFKLHRSLPTTIDESKFVEHFAIQPNQHSLLILKFIEKCLAESQLALQNLDLIAFAHGPGSFTGLRLAASVVQGLAAAHNIPIIPISTLQAMAQGAYETYQIEQVIVALDARVKEIYWGVYALDDHGYMMPLAPDALINPTQASIHPAFNRSKKIGGIGDAWHAYKDILQQQCPTLATIQPEHYPRARHIAKLAIAKYHCDGRAATISAVNALPIYLQSPYSTEPPTK
jgi:tRNA threonylcarbamoyladenosine biosynthesis protein TsaB